MVHVLLIFAGILLLGSLFFVFSQKKQTAEKGQLAVEQQLSKVRGDVQRLKQQIEAGKQAVERLESRIADRNQEIRLLKENVASQERQVRMANASGW